MATAVARSLRRIIPQFARLNERLTFGTMDDAYEAAHEELDLHNYKNAWALFVEVLGQDLFQRWRSMPGHENATTTDRGALLLKLYGSKQIDKWEFHLFKAIIEHPHGYSLRKSDLLAAVIKVFAYHNPGPMVEAKPAPTPKPLPTPREVEAERNRLAAERAAFMERGDDDALPHWKAHHRALAALGLCG